MSDLLRRSIEVILSHQAPSGAYPASPAFPNYRYSWFRDGAFIAYAMDVVGEHASARRFHDWAAQTLLRHQHRAERAIVKVARGEPLGEDYVQTRYTLEGDEARQEWPDFQLDGLGTWLWALQEHVQRTTASLPPLWADAVTLVARYLSALWRHPCYDLWEEHPDYLHPYTLATVYCGLNVAERLLAPERSKALSLAETRKCIRDFVLSHGVRDGHLSKSIVPRDGRLIPSPLVDASLIGVATPHRFLSSDDPLVRRTVSRIERDLRYPGGGVYRYQLDTYYGGGEWVLLAAWLGWYYVEVGRSEDARALLAWVEAQADERGYLPEQVSDHLLAPEYYAQWEQEWGPVAKPLLWSHAMYIILHQALAHR